MPKAPRGPGAGKVNYQSTRRRVRRRALRPVGRGDREEGPVFYRSKGGRRGGSKRDWRTEGRMDMKVFQPGSRQRERVSQTWQKKYGRERVLHFCVMVLGIARATMRLRARLKGALGVSRASRDDVVRARRASDGGRGRGDWRVFEEGWGVELSYIDW